MESIPFVATLVIALVLVGGFWLLTRGFGKTRHRITRPELRNQALEESEKLATLVDKREAHRPSNDPVIEDHQLAHRRLTAYDEETQEVYQREHMPKVAELREHFAARSIRNGMLDDLYENAQNEADLRTISTALQEMAVRLET